MFNIKVLDSGPCHGIDVSRNDLNIDVKYSQDFDTFGSNSSLTFTISDKAGTYFGYGNTLEEAFEDVAANMIRVQFRLQEEEEEKARAAREAEKIRKKLAKKGK